MEVSNFVNEDIRSVETQPLTVPAKLLVPSENRKVQSSFESFAIFKDSTFFDTNAERYCKKGSLFQGPKRFCRLCLFGLIVPVFLISIPLYLRLILYPPTRTPIAPTDQRLLSGRTSSIWCQGQTVEMNGSFNAFLLDKPPKLQQELQTHTMRKHIILRDDVKEYWGFFLQKGSIVIIDLCNRYDGGFLMILRGVNNLRKCAWIGEKDSAEENDDNNEASNEFRDIHEAFLNFSGSLNVQSPKLDHSLNFQTDEDISSLERKRELDYFIGRILRLGKDSDEINKHLGKYKSSLKKNMSLLNKLSRDDIEKQDYTKDEEALIKVDKRDIKERFKMQLSKIVENSAGEELDNINTDVLDKNNISPQYSTTREIENELYKQIFHLPKGFVLERGTFFQKESNDSSNEEHRSSFSSSEEALLKCEGLLGAIPLFADRRCLGPESPPANKVTYKIPLSGTYYFVFSSDNEVFDSDLYFNMTLQRAVFDTNKPKATCVNQTTCSLSFSFWSHDQAVVEVPEGDWDSAFILDSKCEPRVAIYLSIIIMVPIFILCCAFN